jgi:hypothetical protein
MKDNHKLLLAFVISAVWVGTAGIYNYINGYSTIAGINIFPLLAWTAGLYIFTKWAPHFDKKPIYVFLVWWISILFIEYVGYHLLGIQLTGGRAGILGTDLLHVPVFAQYYYMLTGPIFYYLTK